MKKGQEKKNPFLALKQIFKSQIQRLSQIDPQLD